MPDIIWPPATVLRVSHSNRVRWTEGLKSACISARMQGASIAEIAAHYSVPVASLSTTIARDARRDVAPKDKRCLPCGCGVGCRCDRGNDLWVAVRVACDGGASGLTCQQARQVYYRHVAGEEKG